MKTYSLNIFEQFTEINYFVSYRQGAFYNSPFSAFNLSLSTGTTEEVIANRKILANHLSTKLSNFVFLNQVAGNNVEVVSKTNAGASTLEYSTAISKTDALITKDKNLFLSILSADCVPVLLFDNEKKIIAAIHAGWRGTAFKIVEKTVKKMISNFETNPKNIFAAIAPSIQSCCYEVGYDVYKIFKQNFNYHKKLFVEKKIKNIY